MQILYGPKVHLKFNSCDIKTAVSAFDEQIAHISWLRGMWISSGRNRRFHRQM